MANKGSPFERDVCKLLSFWWTRDIKDGPRDDVFWRTSNSGGRATGRRKRGKQTYGQTSDICATHPIGELLMDFLTIECKRGYSKFTAYDLLDKPKKAALQMLEKWILQVEEAWKNSGSHSWAIITRRDQRLAVIILPALAIKFLEERTSFMLPNPCLTLRCFTRDESRKGTLHHLYIMRLDHFFREADPEEIVEAVKRL